MFRSHCRNISTQCTLWRNSSTRGTHNKRRLANRKKESVKLFAVVLIWLQPPPSASKGRLYQLHKEKRREVRRCRDLLLRAERGVFGAKKDDLKLAWSSSIVFTLYITLYCSLNFYFLITKTCRQLCKMQNFYEKQPYQVLIIFARNVFHNFISN